MGAGVPGVGEYPSRPGAGVGIMAEQKLRQIWRKKNNNKNWKKTI
jgi:hypothetical protein